MELIDLLGARWVKQESGAGHVRWWADFDAGTRFYVYRMAKDRYDVEMRHSPSASASWAWVEVIADLPSLQEAQQYVTHFHQVGETEGQKQHDTTRWPSLFGPDNPTDD